MGSEEWGMSYQKFSTFIAWADATFPVAAKWRKEPQVDEKHLSSLKLRYAEDGRQSISKSVHCGTPAGRPLRYAWAGPRSHNNYYTSSLSFSGPGC